MGQRLVIDLIKDNKVVAAVYYHWSAYFASTVYELGRLSEAILKADKEGKDKLFAIVQCLEEDEQYTDFDGNKHIRYGGVCGTPEEIKAAKKMFPNYVPKTEYVNRNCGIITFTEERINNFHDWEEGHGEINLDTLEVSHDVTLDPYPFEFDAQTDEDENGDLCEYEFNSGKIKINGKFSPVDAFEGDCESMIKLVKFMKTEYEKCKPW